MKITVTENGPYLVEGDVPLAHAHIVTNEEGESLEWRDGQAVPHPKKYALCRCGSSRTKPFCDGAHARASFDGRETASREPFDRQAKRIEGLTVVLDDAESLCAGARFCDPHGQVWGLVEQSGDARSAKLAVHEAGACPAGRLVARQRTTGNAYEPKLEPSIGLVQDTAAGVSGPIWVRGGVAVIAADGEAYEVRNRVTLCRCGASSNKPFCDGSHISIRFSDSA
jgi:CDGSH-type Zn-finger protein